MGKLTFEQNLARSLGADSSIFVGHVSLEDIGTGAALRKIELAKRAREISGQETFGNAIERAISRLVVLVDDEDEGGTGLSAEQKEAAADRLGALVEINERAAQGQRDDLVIRSLFDAYFVDRDVLAETLAGTLLRSVGDDFAIERHFDPQQTLAHYQAALESAEPSRY